MRRYAIASIVLCAAGGVWTGCSKQPAGGTATQPAEAGKQINVYMWSEYIDPEIPKEFEKATGIKVRVDVYEATEEMIGKLQNAGGVEQYDVVVVSDHAIPVLAKLGLIQPLDKTRIPNSKNVSAQFAAPAYDPQSKYSLPYQWGTMGIIYRKDKIASLEPTWAMFFDPARQPGPFVLIDSMRDMIGATLKYQGKSLNSTKPEDLKAAGELLLATKKSAKLVGFDGGVGGKNKVASGDAAMAIVYSGDAFRAMSEVKELDYVLPREGTVIWVDAMTIPAKAPHADAAHQFIDYILDAEVGAKLSNFNRYATPNAAAMPKITPEDRDNKLIYPDPATIKAMEYIEDVGDSTRVYDEVWTAVKSR